MKLDENPNFLNEYAEHVVKQMKIEPSNVCSHIVNQFEESSTFVREHLDQKFKNQSKVHKQSKITRLKSKIDNLQEELSISQAIYQSMVFNSRK